MRRRNLRESFGGDLAPGGTKKQAPKEARKANTETPVKISVGAAEEPSPPESGKVQEAKGGTPGEASGGQNPPIEEVVALFDALKSSVIKPKKRAKRAKK